MANCQMQDCSEETGSQVSSDTSGANHTVCVCGVETYLERLWRTDLYRNLHQNTYPLLQHLQQDIGMIRYPKPAHIHTPQGNSKLSSSELGYEKGFDLESLSSVVIFMSLLQPPSSPPGAQALQTIESLTLK